MVKHGMIDTNFPTDWNNVPMDAPILVADYADFSGAKQRHFAGYFEGKILAWAGGRTSWTAGQESDVKSWKYAKLIQ